MAFDNGLQGVNMSAATKATASKDFNIGKAISYRTHSSRQLLMKSPKY